MVNTGIATITVTLPGTGLYQGCTIQIQDHAGNTSNVLVLETFLYDTSNLGICFHPNLDITRDECLGLMALYNSTDGDNWTDNTHWTQTPLVSTWSHVTVSGGHVRELLLPNNNLS